MSKKIIFRILLVLVLIIVLGLVLLPGFIKRYAVNNSIELVGRQIEMDKLKVNYFTGMIKITDFKMFEEDGKTEFISFDTLIANLEPFQFFVKEFVMESFYLKGLKGNVIKYDSTFNFDDLLAFHSVIEDTLTSDTIEEEPFRFQLSNIELKEAEFIFEDKPIEKITALRDISFFVPFIGWNQEEKSEAGLRFAFKNEGYFESSINVDPVGGDYEAEITIYHLYLDSFQEYAASYINITKLEGLFNSNIIISGNINEVEKSLLSGYTEILDLSLEDNQNKKFLGAKKLDCIFKEVNVDRMSYKVDSLFINEPYVFFEQDTNTNNFSEIFKLSSESSDSVNIISPDSIQPVEESKDPLFYAVNYVEINDGVVDYKDILTGEPFDYYLSDINLDADSIKSTSQWIDLYAQMLLNKRGTLNAEVGFNPANPLDIKLSYVITDFQLSDLNIYSRFYMGFPIVYGDMYYKSETEILNGQLDSENKIIMTNVELGNKKGGLYSLPIKFALFILKDREGVIKLDVPVRGDLNDPSINIGKIIWTTFKNFIIKIAASPFDLLAGLLSVDPKDIQEIEFDYNDTTLNEYRLKQLDLLLKLEEKKEGLDIELVYFNDYQKEKEGIAIAQAGKLFYDNTSKDYLKEEKEFYDFVFSKIDSDSLAISEACLKLVNQPGLDTIPGYFAKVRYDNIIKYLFSVNDSTSIQTTISDLKSPKNTGSMPLFEVKYSMKESPEENIKHE